MSYAGLKENAVDNPAAFWLDRYAARVSLACEMQANHPQLPFEEAMKAADAAMQYQFDQIFAKGMMK